MPMHCFMFSITQVWLEPKFHSFFGMLIYKLIVLNKIYIQTIIFIRDVAVQNKLDNANNNQILWQILEFLAMGKRSIVKNFRIIL